MNFDTELARLLAIDWTALGTRIDQDHCRLANEFLRNASEIVVASNERVETPYFTSEQMFGGHVPLSSDLREQFRSKLAGNLFALDVVLRHLRVCLLADNGNDLAKRALSLYDPLIRIFEQGGSVDLHHGDLVVDGTWTASLRGWQQRTWPKR